MNTLINYSCHLSMPSTEMSVLGVRFASLPGYHGRIGILPRHAPMIVRLKPGIISLETIKEKDVHFFVWGGVVNIHPTTVYIMTEAFTRLDELDPIVLDQQLTRYQSDLSGTVLDHEQAKLSYKIEITQAMLKALRENRRP